MQIASISIAVALIFSGMFYAITKETESNDKLNIEMAKLGYQQCIYPHNTILWQKDCPKQSE